MTNAPSTGNDYADTGAPDIWDAYDWLTGYGTLTAREVLPEIGLTANSRGRALDIAADLATSRAAAYDVELADTETAIRRLIAEARADMED